jgi:hypothetical protein
MASESPLRAAFVVPANLLALLTAGASSLFTGEPLPALVALGVEAFYLTVLSATPSFRRAVRAKAGAVNRAIDSEKEVKALLDELAPSQRDHFLFLSDLRDKILANYRRLPGGGVLVATSEQRVDALLIAFLRLLATLNSYRKYLGTSDRVALEAELRALQAEVSGEDNPRLKEVKGRRVEILTKRVQRFSQAEESREVVSHQLAGIEDLLRLTHEQSIAIRDPESIGRQLDALSSEVQETEETVREMERFMEMTEDVRGPPTGVRVR